MSEEPKPLKQGWVIQESIGDDAGDQFKDYDPANIPMPSDADTHEYVAKTGHSGWTCTPIMQHAWGQPWSSAFYHTLSVFGAKYIRIIPWNRGMTLECCPGKRITVHLDADNKVEKVDLESSVALPRGVAHGAALDAILRGEEPRNCSGVFINLAGALEAMGAEEGQQP